MRHLSIRIAAAGAVLFLAQQAGAQQSIPYSESFNNPGFENASNLLVGGTGGLNAFEANSELWANTNYYGINNFDNWNFNNGALYAVQASSNGADCGPTNSNCTAFNGAVLLNENGSSTQPLAQMTQTL